MSRPVYILGAGFSKSINECMPLTMELNKLLTTKNADLDINLSNQTFENWLTTNSTDLPFLENFENTERRARSEKIIKSVGDIIEEQTNNASQQEIPDWLEKLIYIWHSENAVVITLNYDTLVERAINTCTLQEISEDLSLNRLYSENITHPSPHSTTPLAYYDQSELLDNNSFQLIKLHGSINWFHTQKDASGMSASKLRVREMFGGKRTINHTEKNISEMAQNLDRLIIPPVTSKETFYSSQISNVLWRTARKLIKETTKLTIIGYSLPPEDFITGQLLKETPDSAKLTIVDKFADSASNTGIVSNLHNIGLVNSPSIYNGSDCTKKFASHIVPNFLCEPSSKPLFIGSTNGQSSPKVLAIDKTNSKFISLNYNQYNEFKNQGMPIKEQLINIYHYIELEFDIYPHLIDYDGEFVLEGIKYKILKVQEFPDRNFATTMKN